jgi:metallo-beta-lactamase family protein
VAPDAIKAVILTHAHLDHSGYLPVLAKEGFKGHVYATKGTLDLCRILLPDSGHLQEEDASFANRHGFSKHTPALPLYTREEAIDCLPLIKAVEFNHSFSPIPGWKATFSSAGHILGAASLLLEVAGRRLLFSGDLGRPDDLIMNPPDKAPDADTVLIESTYGDRAHPKEDVVAELGPALQKIVKRGGIAVVPVFAVGRAQALLHAKPKGNYPILCRCIWTVPWRSTPQIYLCIILVNIDSASKKPMP